MAKLFSQRLSLLLANFSIVTRPRDRILPNQQTLTEHPLTPGRLAGDGGEHYADGAIHWSCLHAPPPGHTAFLPQPRPNRTFSSALGARTRTIPCTLLCNGARTKTHPVRHSASLDSPDKETVEEGIAVHPGVPEPSTGLASNGEISE